MTLYTIKVAAVATGLLFLTACGGGGGSNITIEGRTPTDVTPNSVLVSDLIISGQGVFERVSNVFCTPDLSRCRATFRGVTYTFDTQDNSSVSGTIYTTLGDWGHMDAGAIYVQLDGLQARYAAAGGVVHPNSIPLQGSATWTGDMVGLDSNNRLVRGGAALTIDDLSVPRVDVLLTPQSRQAMAWYDLAVLNGGFSNKRSASDYIRGEFYGPQAEEVGGVFERNGIVGAFGAER